MGAREAAGTGAWMRRLRAIATVYSHVVGCPIAEAEESVLVALAAGATGLGVEDGPTGLVRHGSPGCCTRAHAAGEPCLAHDLEESDERGGEDE